MFLTAAASVAATAAVAAAAALMVAGCDVQHVEGIAADVFLVFFVLLLLHLLLQEGAALLRDVSLDSRYAPSSSSSTDLSSSSSSSTPNACASENSQHR